MGVTSIAWTDRSVNPIRARLHGHVGHHCEKVSAGCANLFGEWVEDAWIVRGKANRVRERVWFSPHCLRTELPLFVEEAVS